jgi:hypothetical protein
MFNCCEGSRELLWLRHGDISEEGERPPLEAVIVGVAKTQNTEKV